LYIGKTAREEIEHRAFIEEEIIDLLEIEHYQEQAGRHASIRPSETG